MLMGRRAKNLPPGPSTLPILGNIHQIPITGLHAKFMQWGEQYGGIFSLKIASSTMIVLFDRKAVHDLVDKKGVIYSERPPNHVADIVTHGDSFAFMNNTPLLYDTPSDVPVFDAMTTVLTAVLVSLIAYFGPGSLHDLLFQATTKTGPLGTDTDGDSDVSSDKCILKRLEEEDKNCVVLFGSQSGNAQEFAEKLAREAHTRFQLRSTVAEIDEYTYQSLHKLPENTIVFFILASYGDGEPTDNAEQFYNFLINEDDDGPFDQLREHGLQNLSYAAFGLGNSSYAHFNAVIRKVDERLQLCGARRLGPVGEADDGKGTNAEDFIEWKDQMWPQAIEAFGLVEQEAGEREPAFEVVEIPNHHGPIFQADYTDRTLAQQAQAVTSHCFAPISEARMLSDAGGRSYIHVELDLKDTKLDYQTGDHLSVCPINSDVEVERFLRVFGLWDKRGETIRVRSLSDDLNPPFPSPCSYESAARFYIDICGPVSREVVSTFANCVSDAKQKTTLRQLGKDKEAFLALTEGSFYNITSVMEALFPGETVNVPFAIIIEALPKLQPRYYSVSSSSALDANKVSITVAIESFPIQNTIRHFSGVATNFILDVASTENEVMSRSRVQPLIYTLPTRRPHLQPSLSVLVRTSTFRLQSDPTIPILMIGPGTGVAPFRGFVRERVAMHRQGKEFTPITLLYGCRKSTEDFLYEEEWKMSDNMPSPPAISVSLSIDPSTFTRGSVSPPSATISITATSHASEHITIFTWHTIFNLKLAQRRKNFICTDLTTGLPLQLESTKGPKRPQFSYEFGGHDDQYFITLEPEKPTTITHRFLRTAGLEGDRVFKPGHRYQLKVRDNEEAEWWRYGRKEDVMSPPGQSSPKDGCEDPSGPPISLSPIDPVEFEVE
ncbi:NCP1-NADPH-cytochrome P450 reductase [Fusarium phyllophilum]|uniref:NADPH--hemoprotein reductase n=1 Tax=Fusarium phyllophilum TaxID=47803 RepID=A0A8H5NFU1_9HYPO|nr:NCP1-NADPH-cytochrome P450 reductase [Fusarium phyllophilum]